jgi:hypothetical protein
MKLTILIFGVTSLICFADESFKQKPDAKLSEIRTEREEKKDADGSVSASIERVYRGEEQILMTVRLKQNRYGVRTIRSYFAKGKIVSEETDYDDGRPQMIRTYSDDTPCQVFRRQPDGSIKPASADELAKLQSSYRELMQGASKEADKR